jgi:hypothetical protein
MTFETTLYVVAWVFAVQQPNNGKIEDRVEFYKPTYTRMAECNAAAIDKERGAAALATAVSKAGGKIPYSRVICVPITVPANGVRATPISLGGV